MVWAVVTELIRGETAKRPNILRRQSFQKARKKVQVISRASKLNGLGGKELGLRLGTKHKYQAVHFLSALLCVPFIHNFKPCSSLDIKNLILPHLNSRQQVLASPLDSLLIYLDFASIPGNTKPNYSLMIFSLLKDCPSH